ncbi:hypothetical protein MW290_04760 [Aquincola tertiaricarbonis]|uniref:Uncharacterized protein n=1 Tax=Aquincola tertiaricarbonis TaxID=391953 RepID=A0ABY4S652_AQUTE|nr:hypothetical protein [Aquincola tertiaricarbonis]URI07899.1 hypothetical protein MW290_04760 [Aquincola tertiaricarbonis]|tara:strand:- start:1607 stop:2119 length:513 start_codon:yes stop_codon:yes gene_type:complete
MIRKAGIVAGEWAALESATASLQDEVEHMVDSLIRLAPVPALPTAGADVLRTRLLSDHQRLACYLTSLLEDLAKLAGLGLAGASHLLDPCAQLSTPAVRRQQRLCATHVLGSLTMITDRVMQARDRVSERITHLQSVADPASCSKDPADEQAWESARAQAAHLLQGLRLA